MRKKRGDINDLTLDGVRKAIKDKKSPPKPKRGSVIQETYWETLIDGLLPSDYEFLNQDEFFATRTYLKDKNSRIVPFIMNQAQHDFTKRRTRRDIVVKPRQIGFSTLFQAEILEWVQRRVGINATTIADNRENTTTLVEIFNRFFNRLPEPEKPMKKGRYPNGIQFPEKDSVVYLGTAGSKKWGRSKTVHYVHASEVAYWPRAEEAMSGLEESVPTDPNREFTTIVKESTPNGVGGYFYEDVQRALRGNSPYKVHFYTWWWAKEFAVPLDKHEKFKYTTEEQELIARVKDQEDRILTPHQIKWRRQKIENKGDIFWQEYPEDIITCFLTSGRPRFNHKRLQERINTQCKPAVHEDLPVKTKGGNVFYQIRIYEKPLSGHDYVIGADSSEGHLVTAGGDTDYSTAIVRNVRTNTQVATVQGRIEPFEFAYILSRLGKYYNIALLGVERNNHGHAVLGHLVHGSSNGVLLPYPNIYIHYDDKRFGWPTTVRTRPMMLADLALEYRYPNSYTIRDDAIINEAMTFIVLENGRAEASYGSHDDLVMADAIAGQLRTSPREESTSTYNPVLIGDF